MVAIASAQVATAVYQSATRGNVPMSLPLEERVLDPFYPRPYRWSGGDASGSPQVRAVCTSFPIRACLPLLICGLAA